MIKRPAERAGLTWDDGLPERIQAETGSDAGALALMAYALDELYQTSHDLKRLTNEAYRAIGGVDGAIGKRAETAFENLTLADKYRLLQRVFRELVTVDERGTATRQRATLSKFEGDDWVLIRAFADARLLVTQDDAVEVAHEAVFRSWTWLKNWIAEAQEDLILLRQVRASADEWARKLKPDFLRWPAERLQPVYAMIERQQPNLGDTERDFIEQEQYRLYRELGFDVYPLSDGQVDVTPSAVVSDTSHQRRYASGVRLNDIGDIRRGVGMKNGLPEGLWLPGAGSNGKYKCEFEVKPFFMPSI
ncbi:MAG: hypothetical protein IPK17_22550 [Chloroflexi bacterium]|uniref:nSTAND1 domain-containing NTPase n=1 Tax=Candidatus Flexifilum breve TaxID=3140694 RepID=UPI0031346EB7|nr:hypothetical protein [Chloroflexota bacterium]